MAEPYKVEEIDVNQLLINLENPRYEILENQREALQAVVKEQGDKLINLAKDIANRGTNPFDLIAVTPYHDGEDEGTDERFIVLEGNRRVTAIKLLLEVALVDTLIDTPRLKKQFKGISKNINLENIHTQTCVVFAEASLADEWIKLKHTGQNQGIGTVPWDAKSIARFSERFGKKSIALQSLDLFKENVELDEQLLEELGKLSITNLSRLLNDPNIRETIGISTDEDGAILLTFPKEEVLKPLKKIVFDLIGRNSTGKKIKVNDIYHKNDRINYIGGFEKDDLPSQKKIDEHLSSLADQTLNSSSMGPLEAVEEESKQLDKIEKKANTNTDSASTLPTSLPKALTEQSKQTERDEQKVHADSASVSSDSSKNNTEKEEPAQDKVKPSKRKTSRRLSSKRKYLVPTGFTLKIDSRRINAIYRELRTLSVEDYTNAVAVLFRVFIEGSIDHYIEKYSVPKCRKEKGRHKLTNKILDVCDFMEKNNILRKSLLAGAKTAASTKNNVLSIDTLNAYIHNHQFSPTPQDLKLSWDNISDFVEALWEENTNS